MYSEKIKKYIYLFALVFIIGLALIYSFSTLTTKPRLWVDEAKSIELSRNFLYFGKLDIQTAPEQFSELPHLLQSTGYPITAPLSLFFNFFGYGLGQARIYMVLWMILALSISFLFLRKLIGNKKAILSILLIATFASFYDSGRTVVGEIPGFAFLVTGFYFWLYKKSYFWSGLFWGLAVVAKPSVFALIIPTIILVFLLERKDFFKKILKVGLGMIPAAIGWIILVLEHPLLKSSWLDIINFYQNPYDSASTAENIIGNILNVPHSTTLIYFGFLFLVIILGRYWLEEGRLRSFYNFVIIYSIFAFGYYLMSPGWLRYILIAELLIFFLLPSALSIIVLRLRTYWLPVGFVMLLVVIQFIHLFTAAQIFYSDSAIQISSFLNKEFPGKSIGTMNSLDISILLETTERFQIVEMTGIPALGKNPLFLDSLPEVIVSWPDDKFLSEVRPILIDNYEFYTTVEGYHIYLSDSL